MNREMAASVALRAAALLEMSPTKNHLARTAQGLPCPPESDAAKSFCTIGAIDRAIFEIGRDVRYHEIADPLTDRCAAHFGSWSIPYVNNDEPDGQQFLVAALRAIARDLDRDRSE